MSKQVLLSPLGAIRYGGIKHSLAQQFYATKEDADAFIAAGRAVEVTKDVAKALAAHAAGDASALADARKT